MKTKFTAFIDEIDAVKWKRLVSEFMLDLFKKAGVEFLNVAMPKIPVWTGFAGSAFKALGEAVGKNISVSSRGVRFVKTRSGAAKVRVFRNEYYYPPGAARIKKDNQKGRGFATKKEDIINVTGISRATGRLTFYFKFEIDITYFNLLDRDKWHSFEEGSAIFTQYVEAHLANLPAITDAIVRKEVR